MKQAALTDVMVRKAKARDKRYILMDGQGLQLEVMTSGSKFWQMLYCVDGKRKRITLGEYLALSAWASAAQVRAERPLLQNSDTPHLLADLCDQGSHSVHHVKRWLIIAHLYLPPTHFPCADDGGLQRDLADLRDFFRLKIAKPLQKNLWHEEL